MDPSDRDVYISAVRTASVTLELKAADKRGVLEELVGMLAAGGQIGDAPAVLDAVLERESRLSTGLQSGVAMPHGRSLAVDSLAVAIGLKHGGIDFEALDGEPSQIFVLMVSSVLDADPHRIFLGELSKRLNSEAGRRRVLAAESAAELIACLTDGNGKGGV